jgi:hypothetical protein
MGHQDCLQSDSSWHTSRSRGVPHVEAALAGDVGMLAFREGYAECVGEENQEDLAELLRSAMSRLRRPVTELG